MSAREDTPRSLRAASIRGPTPGNSVTGRERSSVRVVRSGIRVPAGPGSALEVGHAIRPRTDVGTDDPAYLGHELLLYPEPLCELREPLGSRGVPEEKGTSGLGYGLDLLDDRRHLPLAPAGPLVRDNLPVLDPQNRANIEGSSDQASRPTDAPALRQVFQRAYGEEDVAASDRDLSRPPDVPELPALVYLPQSLPQDQTRTHLSALGVEHPHRWPLDHLRGGYCGIIGAAELAGEGEDQDVIVCVESLVGLHEVARRGLGGGWEVVGDDQPLVELRGGHVDLVPVALVGAEVEGQRHDAQVRTLEGAGREARRRVRNYRGCHSATICSGYS